MNRGFPGMDAERRARAAFGGPAGEVVRLIAGVPLIPSRDRAKLGGLAPFEVAPR